LTNTVPAETIDTILQRLVRLDEHKPGNGFGLEIVEEIATRYAGTLSLRNVESGFVAKAGSAFQSPSAVSTARAQREPNNKGGVGE
jgi:signal transduction histidine kinase